MSLPVFREADFESVELAHPNFAIGDIVHWGGPNEGRRHHKGHEGYGEIQELDHARGVVTIRLLAEREDGKLYVDPTAEKKTIAFSKINKVNKEIVGGATQGGQSSLSYITDEELEQHFHDLVETFSKPGTADVTASDKKKLASLLAHYAGKAHPFTSCYKDQVKHGLAPDHAKRRCAVLKDLIVGDTGWRKGGKRG
jgi:hypothetical protein